MKAFDLVQALERLVDSVDDEVLLLDGPMDFKLVKSEDGQVYIQAVDTNGEPV